MQLNYHMIAFMVFQIYITWYFLFYEMGKKNIVKE